MDLRVFANRHLIPRTLAAVLSVVVAEATAADQSSRQRLADQFVRDALGLVERDPLTVDSIHTKRAGEKKRME